MCELKPIYMCCYCCCFCDLDWQTIWTAIGSIAAIVGLYFIWHQLWLQAWNECQKIFTDEKFVDSRSAILNILPPSNHDPKNIDTLETHVKRVCRQMDALCCLASSVGEKRLIKTWKRPIGKAYGLLSWYIVSAGYYDTNTTKWNAFKKIGEKCLAEFELSEKETIKTKAQNIKDALQMTVKNVFPDIISQHPTADILIDGVTSHLVQAGHQQFIFMQFDKDIEVPEHSHEAQWGVVLDGTMELTIAGQKRILTKGDSYFIDKDVRHSAKIKAGYTDLTLFNQPDRYKIKK